MDDYAEFGNFAVMLADLDCRERMIKRNSSAGVIATMTRPSYRSGTPGHHTARIQHEQRLNRTFGSPQAKTLNRTKGTIPEYGNFANYASHMIRHTGKSMS